MVTVDILYTPQTQTFCSKIDLGWGTSNVVFSCSGVFWRYKRRALGVIVPCTALESIVPQKWAHFWFQSFFSFRAVFHSKRLILHFYWNRSVRATFLLTSKVVAILFFLYFWVSCDREIKLKLKYKAEVPGVSGNIVVKWYMYDLYNTLARESSIFFLR